MITFLNVVLIIALGCFMVWKFKLSRDPLKKMEVKTTGHGQHGTARWSTHNEMDKDFEKVEYTPELWRRGESLPDAQGIIVHCETNEEAAEYDKASLVQGEDKKPSLKDRIKNIKTRKDALVTQDETLNCYVDSGDVHMLLIGASGIGKTANFLYPNIEYAFASGMSFITTDTKGDLYRNTATIGKKYYGYKIKIIDLRNPTQSSGYNMIYLINKYMDLYKSTGELRYQSKAEKYAKITAKTIIEMGVDPGSFGQNSYFYDSAEGLVTAALLLVSTYGEPGERHIVSVFKLIQDMLEPSKKQGMNQLQVLMNLLPNDSRARWYAASAMKTSSETMMSVMSTAMSRLLSFLDAELEQLMCFQNSVDVEKFCNEKTAIYITLPEEDTTKHFMASLFIQQMYREMLEVADSNGGKLNNRVMFYCDELGTMPKIDGLEAMFSAARSRKISIVAIIQSLSQFEKTYGKEGSEIIQDNCQLTLFGGFAPNSKTAEVLAQNLGKMTIESTSVNYNTAGGILETASGRTVSMSERPLMTVDELKNMPKGHFILMKTGSYPFRTALKLFLKWGITFEEEYKVKKKAIRKPKYIDKVRLTDAVIDAKFDAGEITME